MSERASPIDWAAISRGTWLALVGGVLLVIAPFLDWYSVSAEVEGITLVSIGGSGWDTTDVAKLVFVIGLVVLAVVAIELFAANITLPVAASTVLLGLGGLAALLVLYRIVDIPGDTEGLDGVDIGRSFGLFLALIAAGLVAAAGYLKLQESSGPAPEVQQT